MKLTDKQEEDLDNALARCILRDRIKGLFRVDTQGEYAKGWNDCLLDVLNEQRELAALALEEALKDA